MELMSGEELQIVLEAHNLWLRHKDGQMANLMGANLRNVSLMGANLRSANLMDANLMDANLRGANLRGANLTGANLDGVNLTGANLRGANLTGADLRDADLRDANLRNANLRDADLRAFGDMLYLKTMQFDRWPIGYTHDTLQIGCQNHSIEKWKKWGTEVGRKWVQKMDDYALDWADKYLDIVLFIVEKSPAKKD